MIKDFAHPGGNATGVHYSQLEIVEIGATWSSGFAAPQGSAVYGKPDAIYSGEPWMIYGVEHIADQIIRFAAEQRIPSLFCEAEAAERGGTVAYGVNMTRDLGRAADQLARVLNGAKPGELAVDISTEYELVVNRKAAAALGITIPGSLLARANRVIE